MEGKTATRIKPASLLASHLRKAVWEINDKAINASILTEDDKQKGQGMHFIFNNERNCLEV